MLGQDQQHLRIFLGFPSNVELERGIAYKDIHEVEEILRVFKDHNLGSLIVLPHILGGEKHFPDIGLPKQLILRKFAIEDSYIFIFILWKRFETPPTHHPHVLHLLLFDNWERFFIQTNQTNVFSSSMKSIASKLTLKLIGQVLTIFCVTFSCLQFR